MELYRAPAAIEAQAMVIRLMGDLGGAPNPAWKILAKLDDSQLHSSTQLPIVLADLARMSAPGQSEKDFIRRALDADAVEGPLADRLRRLLS